MKIGLRNFGPIKEFDIDLDKDFHLLIGRNSIGKSYAITAIYLIIKNLVELSKVRNFSFYSLIGDILSSNENSLLNNSDLIKSILNGINEKDIEVTSYLNDDILY
ncbi:ATP-binding protein, partial [Phytobacter diazotrophicus]|uniref:AAA family ATPase n=1 Tax=Phytobacter diazotrophicus TaxID=395631 RepID=UPI001C9A06DE